MVVLGKRKAEGGQAASQSASASDVAPVAKKQQLRHASGQQHGHSHSHSHGHGHKGGKGPAVLGRAERAALRKERRASKPHSDIIENANQLYRFDFKRMEAAERRAKIADLIARTVGRVADVLTKHDTSRVFQLMVKYGSGEQRQQLGDACKGSVLALCVNHYAHHFVLKLLQYGSPVVRQAVWRELQGHVSQLAFHADGAVVFDYLFASEKSRRVQLAMSRELLHPSFALAAQTSALMSADITSARSGGGGSGGGGGGGTLAELCASHPALAASMVETVGGLLERWLNKNQLQYRFVHAMARQYLELPASQLPRPARADFLASLCSSPSLAALCASNDGVMALCMAVSDGGAKERKQVMRCLRADALTVCRSLYGHLLLMRVVECVDDTVAVGKNVWSGLLSDPRAVAQLIDDVHGAKVVRFMLHGKASSQFLSPFEASFQTASQQADATVDGSTSNGSNTGPEGAIASSAGSKKDSVLRHEEHLALCLLPLMSVFQLDEYARDNPPQLSPAQLAAQVMPSEDRDDEAAEQLASAAVSLDALLRSPAASPVLLEVLHTAQAAMEAAGDAVKSAALSALRPQLEQAMEAALDKLVAAAAHSTTHCSQQQHGAQQHAGTESGAVESASAAGPVGATASQSQPPPSLFEDKTAHYFLKRLLAPNVQSKAERSPSGAKQQQRQPRQDGEEAAGLELPTARWWRELGRRFAERLLRTFQTSPAVLLSAASSNRGCFVLLALIDALDAPQQTELAQLCTRQTLHAAIEAALSSQQHDRQQQQQVLGQGQRQAQQPTAEPAKKRKRAQRKAAAPTDTAYNNVAVMTGCRLLHAWIGGRQEAEQAVLKGHVGKSAAVSVKRGIRAAGVTSHVDGSPAAIPKRSRVSTQRK